jgi:hypothetical protein
MENFKDCPARYDNMLASSVTIIMFGLHACSVRAGQGNLRPLLFDRLATGG